jgi:hypothetical protein
MSRTPRQIAAGNLSWRTPVRNRDQLGDLSANLEMAVALERLRREEAAALRLDGELQAARTVQEYLFPRVAPTLDGATVSIEVVRPRKLAVVRRQVLFGAVASARLGPSVDVSS